MANEKRKVSKPSPQMFLFGDKVKRNPTTTLFAIRRWVVARYSCYSFPRYSFIFFIFW